jgi:hypothetical protein
MVSLPMMANSRWCCKMQLARGKGAPVAHDPGCFRIFVSRIVVMRSMRPHRRRAGWNYATKTTRKIRYQRNSIVSITPLLNDTASPSTIVIGRPA